MVGLRLVYWLRRAEETFDKIQILNICDLLYLNFVISFIEI